MSFFSDEKIQILSANDELFKDEPLVFGNDLDIDDYDNIYFTGKKPPQQNSINRFKFLDSSTIREVNEAVELHVEARSDGRLY